MTYDGDVRRDVTVESDVAGTTYLADAIRWGLALAAVGSAIGGWLGVSMRTAGREPVTRHREVHQH